MIWVILVFLLSLQFGLYGAYAGSAIVFLISIFGAFKRRWKPPGLVLYWIVGIWFIFSLISYAVTFSFDLENILHLLQFSWVLVLFGLLFLLERSRPNEDVLWNCGFLFFGFGIWQIILSFMPAEIDISFLGLPEQSINLLSQISEINAVFFTFAMGYSLTQIRFFNQSKWLLLGATTCLGLALVMADQPNSIGAVLIALFFMSLIFSFRLWLFFILPIVALLLYEEAGKIIQLAQQFDFKPMLSLVKGYGFLGQGFGNAPQVKVEIIRIFVESGWVGIICFVLIHGYFLQLGLKTWKESSDRNAFNKGLSLGLLGANLNLIGFSLLGPGHSNPANLAVTCFIWAAQVWLALETRVIRRRLG